MPPGGRDFDGAFEMLLPFDLAEIKVLFSGGGPAAERTHQLQGDISRIVAPRVSYPPLLKCLHVY
jgi:hypothetical protein